MKRNAVKVFVVCVACMACMITWHSCVNHEEIANGADDVAIRLRWVKAYEGEVRDSVVAGLMWNLSYLGATLPRRSVATGIVWVSETQCILNVSKLGFSEPALNAWRALFRDLKTSEEYQANNSIDIGRFVMLTLNSSYHYYAITGAATRIADYESKYRYREVRGAITNSAVSLGHRLMQISAFNNVSEISFVAREGSGSLSTGTFVESEYETVDIMANGQQRFALYDKDGNLKAAASPELTRAGKPAKCLWCHEINIQKLFLPNQPVAGYYNDDEFDSIIATAKTMITNYRRGLKSDLSFNKTQQHTQGELLYISFMQPSAYRLSNEWGMTLQDVGKLIGAMPTHQHDEFPFLGDLYTRSDVEAFSPYTGIPVPNDAREPSVYEPQIITP